MKNKRLVLKTVWDFTVIAAGCALYAMSFDLFLKANNIVTGGVTGISMIINYLLGKPTIGTLIFAINIPLFLIGWRLIGRRFLIGSIFGTIAVSIFIDLFARLPAPSIEPLLASLYGGVFTGTGLGLVFLHEATTGGTEIIARIFKLKRPYVQMGRAIRFIDLGIISLSALVFQNLNSGLYALIELYVSTLVIDSVVYGFNYAKVAYIISDRQAEIVSAIDARLQRGITLLHGEGAYSKAEKKIILCAIKRQQIVELKAIVKDIDEKAFIILCEAREVLGYGFGSYNKNDL